MAERKADLGPDITGHFGLVFPTEYVKACDLREKDVTVTITRVRLEALTMQGGRREKKPVASLASASGKPLGKRLVLNKTNLKSIAAALGEKDVSKWLGGKVTIYPTTCRSADGTTVECIRVRVRMNPRAQEVTDEMAAEPAPRVDFLDEAEEPAP